MKNITILLAVIFSSCGTSDGSDDGSAQTAKTDKNNTAETQSLPHEDTETGVGVTPATTPTPATVKNVSQDELLLVHTLVALRGAKYSALGFTFIKSDAGSWNDTRLCPGLFKPLAVGDLYQAKMQPLLAALPSSEQLIWGDDVTGNTGTSAYGLALASMTNTQNNYHYSVWETAPMPASWRGQAYCKISDSFIPSESSLSEEARALLGSM